MEDDPKRSPDSPSAKDVVSVESIFTRPRGLGPLEKPFDLATCASFLSLSGGSILYCLSAMCVIYGIGAVLGPVFAGTFTLADTLPCIVALNVYELALLAVLVVIVMWQDVTDDAISLVVLVALFLVVTGIALTTTSPLKSGPPWVLLLGASCFVLAMGKVFVLKRFIGMRISANLWSGLALVLGWNFLAGARFADATIMKGVGRQQWLVSWLVLLAGGVTILLDTVLRRDEPPDASSKKAAFLRRPAMGWVFALLLLAAAGVHQYALGYVFGVDSAFVDYVPLVSILSLVAVQLALHLRTGAGYLEAALAAVPLAVFLLALLEAPHLENPALGIQLLWYPPVFLGLTGATVLALGLRRRCAGLLAVVPLYALGVLLTSTSSGAVPQDLHWQLAGALLVSGLFVAGLLRRSATLCFLAVIVGTGGFSATHAFQGFTRFLGLGWWPGTLGLAGLGTLVVALVFGRMPRALLFLAALGVIVSAFDYLPSHFGYADLFTVLVLGALGVGLWLRFRQWYPVTVLAGPLVYRLVVACVRLSSWRYVLLGFVLLFIGAWVSIRKGKRVKRDATASAASAPPPLDRPSSPAVGDVPSSQPGGS